MNLPPENPGRFSGACVFAFDRRNYRIGGRAAGGKDLSTASRRGWTVTRSELNSHGARLLSDVAELVELASDEACACPRTQNDKRLDERAVKFHYVIRDFTIEGS